MAKAKLDACVITLAAGAVSGVQGPLEIKFGKGERIQKFAYGPTLNDKGELTDVMGLHSTAPTAVLFIGRSGRVFLADFSRYPDSIKGTMVFHGSKQKLGDEYADMDQEDDCFEAAIALDARLAEGKWTADREGFAGISVLMKAIMEVFQKTEAEARAFLKDLTPKEKQGLRTAPELKAVIDRLDAERGKGVDVGGLLGKLKGQAPEGGDDQPAA